VGASVAAGAVGVWGSVASCAAAPLAAISRPAPIAIRDERIIHFVQRISVPLVTPRFTAVHHGYDENGFYDHMLLLRYDQQW
jgi:hypothetical protein